MGSLLIPHSTEGYRNKKLLPKQRVCDAVQVHSGFALCRRCIRASSPLPTTTRHRRGLQADTTLRSTLVKTGRPMQERMKEHERDEVPLHEWLCKNSIYMQNKTFCAWQHSLNCSSTEVIKYKANFRLSDFMESRNRIYKRYFQACFFEREIYLSTKRCFWWTLALW